MRTSTGLSRRIALALVSIALAGAGLEFALRLLGAGPVAANPDQRSLWAYHPHLGWTNRVGHRGVFDNGHFRVHVAINALGLRGPEVTAPKPPSTRRVLVIGDSFAWGFGVEYEEIFGTRLAADLPNTDVINGGVSGYSTDQALLWLRTEGRRYEHDVVVYVLSGNDDIMNHMQLAYWIYYKPSFRLTGEGNLVLQGVPVLRSSASDRFRHALRSRSAIAVSRWPSSVRASAVASANVCRARIASASAACAAILRSFALRSAASEASRAASAAVWASRNSIRDFAAAFGSASEVSNSSATS